MLLTPDPPSRERVERSRGEETGRNQGPTPAAKWPRFDAVRVLPGLTSVIVRAEWRLRLVRGSPPLGGVRSFFGFLHC